MKTPEDPPAPNRLQALRHEALDWAGSAQDAALALRPFAPFVLAVLVFLGGLVLLLSGSAPETNWRAAVVRDVLPLPFAEASHLSASLSGLALIVLARGLALRMAQARFVATVVLVSGAVFSLAKGLEWEAALLLLAVAAALTVSRHAFHRKGDWRSFLRPSPGWLIWVAITLGAVTVIGFLGYRNVTYRSELWWDFAWGGDAPRFLRATLALAIAVAALALDTLINRPVRAKASPQAAPPQVRSLLAQCPDSARQVALLGDKRFLVSPSGDAFLMYGTTGRSWVCLGGPFGAAPACEALIWQLAERADQAGCKPVFYGINAAQMTPLLDLGHAILKTGEVARVDLTIFTLDGPTRKDLRYARGRAQRDGLTFRIMPRAEVPAHIDDLRAVSDAWLDSRRGGEKGFSLGRFDPAYLAEFDHAVMCQDGRIVAFANLWQGADRYEISIDLMRHLPDQTPVLMDAMMTEAILAAQAMGFHWFNLGGAPLSGLRNHPLASVWTRIGTMVYRRGDEFYSFEGLRNFKDKFGPVWSPVYMTCPGGLSIPRALIDVALLISRPRRLADVQAEAVADDALTADPQPFP